MTTETWEQLSQHCWTTADWSMVVDQQGDGTWSLRENVGGRSRSIKTFDSADQAMMWAADWRAGRVTK